MKITKSKLHEVIGCLVTADRMDLAEVLAVTTKPNKWKRKNPKTKKLEYRKSDNRPEGSGWQRVVKKVPRTGYRGGGGGHGVPKKLRK